MPGDYNKLTKPDLEAQLKERGLPHSGKKAELVARLQEDDAKQTAAPEPAAAKEDEIDWDDEAPKEAPVAVPTNGAGAAAPITTQKASQTATPVAAEPASATAAPLATENAATGEAAATEEKPQKDFSLGLAQVTISDELEKLRARAKKFGLTEDQAAQDNIAKLERAQKFGGAESDLIGLNGALPERQRKRRGDHTDESGRVDKHRGGRGGRHRGPRRDGERRQESGNGSNWMSQKDREAAEARKKRFGT